MSDRPQIVGVIKSSRFLGDVLLPCIYRQENPRFLTVDGLFSVEEISDMENMPAFLHEVHGVGASMDPNSLIRRFSKKKLPPGEFFVEAHKHIIDKVLMPFIWKQTNRLLELMRTNEIDIYDSRSSYPNLYPENKIILSDNQAEARLYFNRTDEGTQYKLEVWHKDEQIDLQDPGTFLLTLEPCCLLAGNKLMTFNASIGGKLLMPFLSKASLHIPKHIESQYFEKFIKKIANYVNIEAEGFQILDMDITPQAKIILEQDWQGYHGFTLTFDYVSRSVLANHQQKTFTTLETDNKGFLFKRFRRDITLEKHLTDQLKKIGLQQYGAFFRPPGDDKGLLNFISLAMSYKKELEQAGFEILQHKDQYFALDEPQFTIKYEQLFDWFDLHIKISIAGNEIPFLALRNHILSGEKVFMLPEGHRFLIPDEWFERYKELMIHGSEHAGSLRLGKHHFRILDEFSLSEAYAVEQQINDQKAITYPKLINVELRPYQIQGFLWMRNLAGLRMGGILADDMGLGKTLQVIALLSDYFDDTDEVERKSLPPSKKTKRIKKSQLDLFDVAATSDKPNLKQAAAIHKSAALIVMPTSIIHNWKNEIQRFAPHLRVFEYTGANRNISLQHLKSYHLILTTYGILRNDIDLLKGFWFGYVVLDESQNIKNPDSLTARAAFSLQCSQRITLTGTPIENHLADIWSQMHFVNPGLLGGLTDFKRYYSAPIEKDIEAPEGARLLHLIDPFVLRRTKAQVAPELPPITETTICCDMTESQQKHYEQEKSRLRNLVLEAMIDIEGKQGAPLMVLRALMRLRQYANHPRMADTHSDADSGKFNVVTETLETVIEEGHKVLVFSSFVSHLELLEAHCRKQNIPIAKLTGSTNKREQVIKSFRDQENIKVFLISLKAGGVGLNLTEAGYVFILDPWWNPAAEIQAVNRAHRIGQDKNVFVYRFISKDTVEEKILKLQDKKRQLADSIVQSSQFVSELTQEDVAKLFE